MSAKSRDESAAEHWEEAARFLYAVHGTMQGLFETWSRDVDQFVTDMQGFFKASYFNGYDDALEAVEEATEELKRGE